MTPERRANPASEAIGAEPPYGERLPADSEETQAASVLVVPWSHVQTLSYHASETNPGLESETNGPKVHRSSSDLRPKFLRPRGEVRAGNTKQGFILYRTLATF